MDGIIFTLQDVAKLCNAVPENVRADYRRTTLWCEKDSGLTGILVMHSNETIEGLRRELLADPFMSSTNNF